jgi:hypothetical protein
VSQPSIANLLTEIVRVLEISAAAAGHADDWFSARVCARRDALFIDAAGDYFLLFSGARWSV